MNLKEVMDQKSFAIVGDTLNEEKFAYKIKHQMQENNYDVYCVGKELASINDIPQDIDIVDLCIHPIKGLKLMQECIKPFKYIVIQPGAGNKELKAYLDEKQYPYIESCLLVGLQQYRSK
jgi:predicted CoA-binding protein